MTNEYAIQYDVVVVGAGNAALCAGISAKEEGANVLILERGPLEKRGGNSFFTDGAIRTAFQNLDDIREVIPEITDEEASRIEIPIYNDEDFYNDLMRVTGGKSDPQLARYLTGQSTQIVKWLHRNGVIFELNENQSFENEGKLTFWGNLPLKTQNKGVGLIQQLNQRAKELDIDIWYQSRAVKLVTENEQITAIQIEQPDGVVTVRAGSVILACGGFEANKTMRAEHLGSEWNAAIVRGTEYNTGDGLTMALEVGAQAYGDWAGCHSIGTDYKAPEVGDFTKPGDIYKKSSFPLGLLINKEGNRFVDEGADFRNYTYAKYGREVLKQPGNMAYQIFDAEVHPMLRKEYLLEEATFIKADSMEELADLLAVDKEQFVKTIQEYNQAVQEGTYNPTVKDGKGTKGITPPKSNWALRMEEEPFYAYPVTCGITFTFGGIKVNTQGEVLGNNGSPISGLYAAGEMVGGLFYENYPGGSGLMSGAVFGKIAGTSATHYVRERTNTIANQ
ncbi:MULTISPECIES: FAD-dependent tricarballylate dehydrogenase TcuA [unclassified Paenibacillus]|uniref:FAD-dependent tricarballylate dehydrogenase TcuA n=1 Tax=unclassified Paenibacillus TaxID=185978 RepID=UPI001AEAF30C|nr:MULTISPECIES: FAD-dependent tricarballylate dehydrogenase TcuA [unclassified Paenibacillus]MBP1155786.1 tricarballylate dehydrogenase [Paenibacillus sp. PvP091]MBP1168828.1 tricarballylate dehydrogenase [Paenibacillus sp. PvR098]MBP2439856.1 tricarballylate dehydrogenase [Paenibacillus sp. PvP052]